MKNKLFLYFVLMISSAGTLYGQAGGLDLSFNPQDVGNGYGDAANQAVRTISVQADGKIIIGGDFTAYNGVSINRIARLNADGTLDATFAPGTGANQPIYATAIQADGKILIAGNFNTYNGSTINRITRLNSDGSTDATFTGTGANGIIYAVAIQTDGKIIIGGAFTNYNGTAINRIARLNTDGTLDAAFTPGTGVNNTINTIAIQTDGKIIIGGLFGSYNGTARNRIARINTDGSNDVLFTPGSGANNAINSLALQADGKIVIGGAFTSYNGTARSRIARINDDGTLDASFNPGTGAAGDILTICIQSDGKIMIGGAFMQYNGTARYRIARVNTDGTLDTTYDPSPGAPSGNVLIIKQQADNKCLVGGMFIDGNSIPRNRIARLNTDGTNDDAFNPGTGASLTVQAIAIQSYGKIIAAGSFSHYNGVAENHIARINVDGSLDNTFNTGKGTNSLINSLAIQSDQKIIIGGSFSSYNGTARNYIARLNADGTLDTSFDPGTGANSNVMAIAVQSDGKILIGGYFDTYNGFTRNNLARLNADGSLDATFDPGTGANGNINAITLQSDGKILIGGAFSTYNGSSVNNFARINTDGSLDATFVSGTNGEVFAIAVQWDGKVLVGGNFTVYLSTVRNYMARVNTDGSLDFSFYWSSGADNLVRAIMIQSDGRIIFGGNFTNYNGSTRNRIARVYSNGTIDATFDPVAGANNILFTMGLQWDGRILIGGSFTNYNGTGRNRLARLYQDCGYSAISAVTSWTNNICANDTITLVAQGVVVGAGATLTWYDGPNGTGNNLGGGNPKNVSPAVSTTYFARLAGTCNTVEAFRYINVRPVYSVNNPQEICDGESYSINGHTYDTLGVYYDTLSTVTGCDSIIITQLSVNSNYAFTEYDTICEGDTLHWQGSDYSTAAIYTASYTSSSGCDSIYTLHLMVNPLPIDIHTTAGLLAYYPLNGNANDESGYGNHGGLYNSPVPTADRFLNPNSAYDFNGINAFILIDDPTPPVLQIQNEITLSAWIYVTQYPGSSTLGLIVGSQCDACSAAGATIFLDGRTNSDGQPSPPGHIHFQIGNGSWHVTNSQTQVPLNQWVHIAATRKANEDAKIYYNGVLQPSTSVGWNGSISYAGTFFAIGRQRDYSNRYFKGSIDEVRVYNRALNFQEVTTIFQQMNIYADADTICPNTNTNINLLNSQNGISYQLQINGVNIGSEQTGNGDTLTFSTGVLTTNSPFTIKATNPATTCNIILDTVIEISVSELPLVVSESVSPSSICASGQVVFSATANNGTIKWYDAASGGTEITLLNPTINTTTTYYAEAISTGGCVSYPRIAVTVTVNPDYSIPNPVGICDGSSYVINGHTYSQANTYNDTLTAVTGCDSVIITDLSVYPVYAIIEYDTICDGDSYLWQGSNYSSEGTYYSNHQSVYACDSNYTLYLKVNPAYTFVEYDTICNGDVYHWQGNDYSAEGTYYSYNQTIAGCDSNYTLHLKVGQLYSFNEYDTICNGDSTQWLGSYYATAGTYFMNFQTTLGCDSNYSLHLSVLPSYSFAEYDTIGDGDTLQWYGLTYTSAGEYNKVFSSVSGCDSIYTLYLTQRFDPGQICNWKYYSEISLDNTGNTQSLADYSVLVTVNTNALITPGNMNADGSDIRFTTDFSDNLSYWIEPGIQNEYGMNTNNTHLWVKVPVVNASAITKLYMFYGNPAAPAKSNISNTFLFGDDFKDNIIDTTKWLVLVDNLGQIIEQNQRIEHNSPKTNPQSSSYLYSKKAFTGTTVTEMQFKKGGHVYRGAGMILNHGDWSQTAWCNWQDWGAFGVSVSVNGSSSSYTFRNDSWSRYNNPEYYLKIYRNADSTFRFTEMVPAFEPDGYKYWETTIANNKMSLETPLKVSANEGVWQYASNLYIRYEDDIRVRKYSNPEPVATFSGITLENTPHFVTVDTICEGSSYQWQGNTYVTSVNDTIHYANFLGCDSTYILNLIAHPVFQGTDIAGICNGDTYLWHGQSLNTSGQFYDNHLSIYGCDSNYSLNLIVHPVFQNSDTTEICDGNTYLWHGQSLVSSGLYYDNHLSIYGCDSNYSLYLVVHPVFQNSDTAEICDGDTHSWHGQSLVSSGLYYDNHLSIYGCDSNYSLNLVVHPVFQNSDTAEICNGDTYLWHGQSLNTAGQFYDNHMSVYGCDSLYSLLLNVKTVDIGITLSGVTLTADSVADNFQWVDCNNTYSIISGEIFQTYVATTNGNYAVIITQGSCTDTSVCIPVVTVNISDNYSPRFAIYPNPSDGLLTLILDENAYIKVNNIFGALLYSDAFIKGLHQISLDFADGIYLLTVTSERGSKVIPIVIRK